MIRRSFIFLPSTRSWVSLLMSRVRTALEELAVSIPNSVKICQYTSRIEPDEAVIEKALYSEGWSCPIAYRRAVDLPLPISPVTKAIAPRFMA